MGKFPFKRPRIISKRFPEMNSSIDGVKKSLNDLVFSYSEKVDNALQKKHLMMAISTMVLLIVFGSFISPKGKADSAIFYPNTCLGGWVNPHYAEGMPETTSNGDPSQFTKNNSAVLPKNTNAEMYCGSFKGKFDPLTKPTKIVVSLALTKGEELLLEDKVESGNFASSSRDILDAASSTDVSFTLTTSTSTSTSTSSNQQDSRKGDIATSSIATSSTISVGDSTSSEASSTVDKTASTSDTLTPTAVATPVTVKSDSSSVINGIKESVKDAINTIFNSDNKPAPQTDTVILPSATEQATTSSSQDLQPQSYLPSRVGATIITYLTDTVFAEEGTSSDGAQTTPDVVPQAPSEVPQQQEATPTPVVIVPTIDTPKSDASSSISDATSTVTNEGSSTLHDVLNIDQATTAAIVSETASMITVDLSKSAATSSDTASSSTLGDSAVTATTSTTTTIVTSITNDGTTTASTTPVDDNQFQNNFLEVLYTFDGVTWNVLGELNEISMKYRTFEIPVTASTSWEDLSQLQIKIQAKRHFDETPTVYLDGIKVEVLYETEVNHAHPDFARDTILKDEIIEGIRLVTLVNNETKQQEVWYMHLENASSTESTNGKDIAQDLSISTSSTSTITQATATSTVQDILSATTSSSTSLVSATSTKTVINLMKNTWKKFVGAGDALTSLDIVKAIKKQESIESLESLDLFPDFASDTIKKMKGVFVNTVLVQIKRSSRGETWDELWLYDISTSTPEKIGASTTSPVTVSPDSPIGIKGGYVFWVSLDKKTVYAYSLLSKTLLEKPIPSFDESRGERAEVFFEGILWKIIITSDNFSFSSPETGEVFSDENADVVETLRSKMKLDTVLNKEELSNLSLPVSADSATNSQK